MIVKPLTIDEIKVKEELQAMKEFFFQSNHAFPLDIMRKEEGQVCEINGLKVARIGFLSSSGFESKAGNFDYIEGKGFYDFDS